ncbi:MAG: primosomal protein N' [Planctomycetota bacterium]
MVSLGPYARVALPIPVPELFDYHVPAELDAVVVPGARVKVPFGRGSRIGYCIERAPESRHPEPKDVSEACDAEPVLDSHLLELVRWTAEYYLAPVGEVIEAAVPSGVRRVRPKEVRWVRLVDADAKEKGAGKEARQRLIAILAAAGEAMPADALLAAAEASDSALKTLGKRGVIEVYRAAPPVADKTAVAATAGGGDLLQLTEEQSAAVAEICQALAARHFTPFLLEGVTGSGKTEVYLRAIRRAVADGGGALVLLPEIALTPQTVARFEERFGEVAVLHSMLPAGERAEAYRRLRSGELQVAIGARSAVFAPLPELRLIIIDESHEPSYKQESTPRYHARDVAVMRASLLGIPVVMGTATPSMESLENARSGRYQKLVLAERVTSQSLPQIEIVDRGAESVPRGQAPGLLSKRLLLLLQETMDRDEQAILFLNRRGFARHINCPRCNYVLHCPNCDISLTHHQRAGRAQCHYCDADRKIPEACPECQFTGLRNRSPGTERIESVLERLFPGLPIGRLDRDTVRNRHQLEEILETFRRGETRILVGTQMLAKGHDIPGVTLVGVIDADVALHLPDFRAAERTAQLICQVAGRAGRGERPGRVVIQTRQPTHYAILAGQQQQPDLLLANESTTRKLLRYPPFGFLVRMICEDGVEKRARETAQRIKDQITPWAQQREIAVLGPAPAPLARLRGSYRYHILLKGAQRSELREIVRPFLAQKVGSSTTRLTVDVDPQSLL